MTPPKAADMAGWGEPAPTHWQLPTCIRWHPVGVACDCPDAAWMFEREAAYYRRPSLLRRFMRRVWRRG